jgi:hypothetical protein
LIVVEELRHGKSRLAFKSMRIMKRGGPGATDAPPQLSEELQSLRPNREPGTAAADIAPTEALAKAQRDAAVVFRPTTKFARCGPAYRAGAMLIGRLHSPQTRDPARLGLGLADDPDRTPPLRLRRRCASGINTARPCQPRKRMECAEVRAPGMRRNDCDHTPDAPERAAQCV